MRFAKLLAERNTPGSQTRQPTVAFLGDSVTHGCFELYMKDEKSFETYVDQDHCYQEDLRKILHLLYPWCQVGTINAGVSGDTAAGGAARLERDVLSYHPDLVVVCFGLNDACRGEDFLPVYEESLGKIFDEVRKSGAEAIFMTPNMMNTSLSPRLLARGEPIIRGAAEGCLAVQNGGRLERFLAAGKTTAEKYGVPVCDVYAKWKKLSEKGVDVTSLLANDINHPSREMHWLFAVSLMETILS